ncbi:MAG: DUF5906 domain-containing protein [Planctomycetota bacterium]|jgi:hypothetical protein
MRNERTTEAYRLYYENVLKDKHNNPDLIARWGADPGRFETQIMCHKAGTKLDNGKFKADGEIFGPHRWPYDPAGEANYSDPPLPYRIATRMKCIGTTWWDWKNKNTVGLGFDFDSIVGHAEGVGVSDAQIAALDEIDVPWLEVVRSTRGAGRHIYIWFKEPFPVTENHTEHAALARSYIPLIAQHTGLDIEASVDVCGGVMWIHHTNANKENRGYALVKPATQILTADFVPPNWRDHLEVVSGGRAKVRVQGWTSNGTATEGDELDEMTKAHAKVELDETHLKILEDLESTGHSSLWVHDHHLWQGHTGGLKQVFDDWEERGSPMRGLFDTNSRDSDPGKPNCFMRPKLGGAWDVYRFGEGTEECALWGSQGKWTHTVYNYPATLKQICLACGGYEGTEEKQGYLFDTPEELMEALKLLGSKLVLPARAEGRGLTLYSGSGGKVILAIEKTRKDEKVDFPRYVKTTRGWEIWIKDVIETSDQEIEEENLWSTLDDQMRALKIKTKKGGAFDSWVMKDDDDGWTRHPRENIKSFLMSQGHAKPEIVLGGAVFKSWTLINEPFSPEYPGGRMWNRDAAQFVYPAAELKADEVPHHPTWTRVMEHCGIELNEYIAELDWCKDWGITTGGDYLVAWIACMFRNPFGKLPYLFMYGPQNSGKSSFHESVALLLSQGVAKADRALTSEQGYNGELMDAVLAVVDEVDVAKAGSGAYNKLKEWVTGLTISIRDLYKPVQDVVSTLHFVQMSNSRSSLPVFPGDTRITAMNVPSLEEEIPRDRLQELLKEEAPHFMRTLTDVEIPPPTGRLMLPIIETQGKMDAAAGNIDELGQFIEDQCHEIPGAAVKLSEFQDRFLASIEEHLRADWNKQTIRKRLAEKFPIGKGAKANQIIVGNVTFNPNANPGAPYVKSGNKLVREEV